MALTETRRRGRPKGSTNKPRAAVQTNLFTGPYASGQGSVSAAHSLKIPQIFIRLNKPTPTQVFSTYWWFACERQNIFFKKLKFPKGNWTDDQTLRVHKFTNAYRASDRVSQYLIKSVLKADTPSRDDPNETFFRCLLFKIFNKIETWDLLQKKLGPLHWENFSFEKYDRVLNEAMADGITIYSAAYIMASPKLGHQRKHSNHLALLERMIADQLPQRIFQRGNSMAHAYELLRSYPGIGDFLAYQYAVDLNYSGLLSASENDFVVPGPGALNGISKCFSDMGDYCPVDVIKYACDIQNEAFAALGLKFRNLWGRSLHLIDCQNLFCEVDKYARVHHPEYLGPSQRKRIKQLYRPSSGTLAYAFPMKWGLNERIAKDPLGESCDAHI